MTIILTLSCNKYIPTIRINNLRGGMGREMGGRFKKEGVYVHLWLILVEF